MKKIMLVVVLALFGCTQENDRSAAATSATGAAGPVDNAALLDELVEAYFEEILELNPLYATFIGDNRYNDRLANSLSPEYLEKSRALERKYLAALLAIDNGDLGGQDLLTFEIFRLDRETSIAGERFPGELLPLNQSFSLANFFAVMGSGQSVQPFASVGDYENFLSRADDFVEYLDQAIVISIMRLLLAIIDITIAWPTAFLPSTWKNRERWRENIWPPCWRSITAIWVDRTC